MKIEDINVKLVSVPLQKVFRGGTYQIDERCTVIVTLRSDDGLVGQIYSGDERRSYRDVKEIILGPMKQLLIGEHPFDTERIWSELFQLTLRLPKGIAMRALSAVDLALWDLKCKSLGVPLHKLLGGCKPEIPIIGYTYYEEDQDLAKLADNAVSQKEVSGCGGTKLKVGEGTIEDDLRRVEAIRRATGNDFILACDANMAWTPPQAIAFAQAASEYDIAWLEEPVHWYDQAEGMRKIRASTSVPVTAGQSEMSGFGCKNLLEKGAVDFLNVDVSMAGGITEWRRIAAMAHFFDVGMVHHEEPQVAIHLLSSIPHSYCAEFFSDPDRDPIWHQMFVGHPKAHNGLIRPLEVAGLGIEIDWDFVRKYEVV